MTVARVENTDHTRVNLIRRTEPRNAIIHQTGWEVHHVTDGRATIVTGGRVDRTTDADGETTAVILDGEARTVGPGDVVIVPPGTPHWYSTIDEPVTYLEIRYDPAPGDGTPLPAPLVRNWRDADWGPPSDREGFPSGLRNAPVSVDPATGGPTYLARLVRPARSSRRTGTATRRPSSCWRVRWTSRWRARATPRPPAAT